MAVFGLSMLAAFAAGIRYLAASGDTAPLMVVQDADPGADDAMAMLMLLSKKSQVKLLAVTIVEGNTGVKNASLNAWLVLKTAKRTDIPIYRGSDGHGLVFDNVIDNFFGHDGFGDAFQKPLNARLKVQHAATALVDLVKKHPGKVSVLCTGPLTNVALAIHLYPEFLQNVKEMVVLGGAYRGGGNIKPGAEFNFVSDPEAASLVFSKVPEDKLITVIPLETVVSNSFSIDWRLNVLGRINSSWIRFLNLAERKSIPKVKAWAPFDQLAAAVLLNPNVATNWTDTKIFVETCGEHGRGAVFVDYTSTTANARIITDFKKELLQNMLLSLLDEE